MLGTGTSYRGWSNKLTARLIQNDQVADLTSCIAVHEGLAYDQLS